VGRGTGTASSWGWKRNQSRKNWEVPLTAESRPVIDVLAVEFLLRRPRGTDDPGDFSASSVSTDRPITVDVAGALRELAERAAHVPHLGGGC
jgi:hypothetical protein